jgi:hypothetical protein
MSFPDRMGTPSAGSVLTHLTSRDGVPRIRSGSPEARGPDSERGDESIWSGRWRVNYVRSKT